MSILLNLPGLFSVAFLELMKQNVKCVQITTPAMTVVHSDSDNFREQMGWCMSVTLFLWFGTGHCNGIRGWGKITIIMTVYAFFYEKC